MTIGYDLADVRLRPPPRRNVAGGEWDWYFALSFGDQMSCRRRMVVGGMGPDDVADLVGADVDTACTRWRLAIRGERLGADVDVDDLYDNSDLFEHPGDRWVSGDDVAAVVGDLVGPGEIAARLGVKATTVHQWRFRGLLPDPMAVLTSTPIWRWTDIEAWAVETGRV